MVLPIFTRPQLDEAMRLYYSHSDTPFDSNMVGNNGGDQARAVGSS